MLRDRRVWMEMSTVKERLRSSYLVIQVKGRETCGDTHSHRLMLIGLPRYRDKTLDTLIYCGSTCG